MPARVLVEAPDWPLTCEAIERAKAAWPPRCPKHPGITGLIEVRWSRPEQIYYAILGVEANASEEEITAGYRRAAMVHHPDRSDQDSDRASRSGSRMAAINVAYETLGDPVRRAQYDAQAGRRA